MFEPVSYDNENAVADALYNVAKEIYRLMLELEATKCEASAATRALCDALLEIAEAIREKKS